MKFVIKFVATGFGTGYSPIAPGTVGSAVGMALYFFFLPFINNVSFLIIIIVTFFLGVYVSTVVENDYKEKDPSIVVIDEIVGVWISFFMLPHTGILSLGIAFFAFRFFDIVKLFPINKMQDFKGGWGIMNDDVLAGIYANLTTRIVLKLLE
jgi:phosphatidylglycerophosphatase A